MKTRSYRDRLNPEGRKKLLALDRGGIQGVIALEVPARIEEILREPSGQKNLVLSDYFEWERTPCFSSPTLLVSFWAGLR